MSATSGEWFGLVAWIRLWFTLRKFKQKMVNEYRPIRPTVLPVTFINGKRRFPPSRSQSIQLTVMADVGSAGHVQTLLWSFRLTTKQACL